MRRHFTTRRRFGAGVRTALAALLVGGLASCATAPGGCAPAAGIHRCGVDPTASDRFVDAIAENVVMIPNPNHPGAQLEVTVFRRQKDRGRAGQPLAVVNHGSAGLADSSKQPRNRPFETAKYFLERGYIVVAPMRTGFSRSTGPKPRFRCDHYAYALKFEHEIEGTIDYFVREYSADPDNVVVTGQSNGGIVAAGYAARPNKAKLVVNFAGGIDTPGCDWAPAMIESGRSFGRNSKLPMVWIYTGTDRTFPPDVSVPFYRNYRESGGNGEFYLFDDGGHGFSDSRVGRLNYAALLDEKLRQYGLPYERR